MCQVVNVLIYQCFNVLVINVIVCQSFSVALCECCNVTMF
jgi:hypothetical protein